MRSIFCLIFTLMITTSCGSRYSSNPGNNGAANNPSIPNFTTGKAPLLHDFYYQDAGFSVRYQSASSIGIGWGTHTDPNILGYHAYIGNISGQYTLKVALGYQPTYSTDLLAGINYFFIAKSFNATGEESVLAKEVNCYDVDMKFVEWHFGVAVPYYQLTYLKPTGAAFAPAFKYNPSFNGTNVTAPTWTDVVSTVISNQDNKDGTTTEVAQIPMPIPFPAHLMLLRSNFCQ